MAQYLSVPTGAECKMAMHEAFEDLEAAGLHRDSFWKEVPCNFGRNVTDFAPHKAVKSIV